MPARYTLSVNQLTGTLEEHELDQLRSLAGEPGVMPRSPAIFLRIAPPPVHALPRTGRRHPS